MGRQMEGDSRQRRRQTRQAREEGATASEAGVVTLGARKHDHSLGNDAEQPGSRRV